LGTGTGKGTKFAAQPQSQRQYVKDIFYVILSHNRRKVKVKGVYVDVINIYGENMHPPRKHVSRKHVSRKHASSEKTCFEKTCFEKTCILREQIHGQSILKSNTHALALQWEFHEKREK
jgi:hypothetical protein